MMALVHDLAEAQGEYVRRIPVSFLIKWVVGDITPHEGISKAEKKRLEAVILGDEGCCAWC